MCLYTVCAKNDVVLSNDCLYVSNVLFCRSIVKLALRVYIRNILWFPFDCFNVIYLVLAAGEWPKKRDKRAIHRVYLERRIQYNAVWFVTCMTRLIKIIHELYLRNNVHRFTYFVFYIQIIYFFDWKFDMSLLWLPSAFCLWQLIVV